MPSSDERTPLLWSQNRTQYEDLGEDSHSQFCALVGVPPSISSFNVNPKDAKKASIKHQIYKTSLYGRATTELAAQRRAYNFSAALNNTLLLSQVVLGATLTGLGASASSPLLVTIFGAMNTIIAGIVAYLKSRGQPMRARMYRDDLERVVDEIENSEIMWRGISGGVHGYDEIDTESQVTVRSEVARLTRLYDRAVRNNTMNNPDMYMAGGGYDGSTSGLRNRGNQGNVPIGVTLPAVAPAPAPVTSGGQTAAPAPAPPPADPDQSPASAPPKPKEAPKKEEGDDTKKDENKAESPKAGDNNEDKGKAVEGSVSEPGSGSSSTPTPAPDPAPDPAPAPAPTPAPAPAAPNLMDDPDASPASAPVLQRRSTKDDAPKKVKGEDE